MAQYTMKVQSRPLWASEDQVVVGELFAGNVKCEFRDDSATLKTFDVTVDTDQYRQTTESSYHTDVQVINNDAYITGRIYWRNFVQFIPRASLFGNFFRVLVEKVIPTDGNFKYFGIDLAVIPHPELDAEFLFGGNAINNGWPT